MHQKTLMALKGAQYFTIEILFIVVHRALLIILIVNISNDILSCENVYFMRHTVPDGSGTHLKYTQKQSALEISIFQAQLMRFSLGSVWPKWGVAQPQSGKRIRSKLTLNEHYGTM